MKYDSTNSAPYLINGRVLIHMVGTTPKMKTIMMEAQNEDISSSHVDDADVYGQKAYLRMLPAQRLPTQLSHTTTWAT